MSKISFISWVNDAKKYAGFVESTKSFDCEYIILGSEYPTMASAYNAGTERATGDILVYVHQDVRIQDKNFVHKLKDALKNPKTGFIGVAGSVGGSDMGMWCEMPKEHLRGYVIHNNKRIGAGSYNGPARLLDGLLLATKRKFNFPEYLPHIHYLDAWMCKLAMSEGLVNWIIDSEVIHLSLGEFGGEHFISNKELYMKKWFYQDSYTEVSAMRALNRLQLSKFKDKKNYKKLSIIIAVFNQSYYTKYCLDSLIKDVPDAEIIIINNGSTDDTLHILGKFPTIRIVNLSKNIGVPAAWNKGLSLATGDVLGVLNNDTIIHKWGMRALAYLASETGISAVKGGILTPELAFAGHTDSPEEADYPEGCCLLFRRDVWNNVGKFDEIFSPAYCEDSDWGLRARLKGYKWKFVPSALEHMVGKTSRAVSIDLQKNLETLRARWQNTGAGQRILIRRWNAIGDILMATPAIKSLREQLPLARIHLQTREQNVSFLSTLPCIDYVSSHTEWRYTRHINLDEAYEKYRVKGIHFPAQMAFAQVMNVPIQATSYVIPKTPSEIIAWAEKKLPQRNIIGVGLRSYGRPYANWSADKWRKLFTQCQDITFILLDQESKPNINVNNKAQDNSLYDLPNVIDFTGHTPTLHHVVALLSKCRACITVDTGVLHLASAMNIPLVGLFAGTPIAARAPLVGTYSMLQGDSSCFPCNSHTLCNRTDGEHCLDWLNADRVEQELRRILTIG